MDALNEALWRLRAPEYQERLGYVYALISGVGGVVAAAFAQALHGSVPGYELAAVRFCHFCTIVIPRAVILKADVRLELEKVPWVLLITAFTVLWNIFFYMAAKDVPLGTLMTAYTSLTYLEIVVLARIFLKQDFIWGHAVLAVLVLAGNILLMQPSPPLPRPTYPCNVTMYDGGSLRPPMDMVGYVPMFLATGLASTSTVIYKCKLSDVPLVTASVWIGVSGLFTTTGLTIYLTQPVLVNGIQTLGLLLGHGVGAAINTVFLQHALKVLWPDKLAGLDISKCLLGFLLQYGVAEFASGFANYYEMIGAVLAVLGILSSVIVVLKSNYVWFKKEPKLLPGEFDFHGE